LAQIKINKMRKVAITLTLVTGAMISASAQIFINTGNPNMDKYKQDNPNAVIWQGEKDAKTVEPAKTTTTTTTTTVTTPKATVTTPAVKATTPAVKVTTPTVKLQQLKLLHRLHLL
jgi:hypothetical protein